MDNPLPNGSHASYRIISSKAVNDGLKTLAAQAEVQGITDSLIEALNAVSARLQYSPLHFGEPSKDLLSLKLQVRRGAVKGLGIAYAVDPVNRIVYLLTVNALGSLGLKETE
jgi:hypothetical protein